MKIATTLTAGAAIAQMGWTSRGRDPDADAVEPKARSTFCTILR